MSIIHHPSGHELFPVPPGPIDPKFREAIAAKLLPVYGEVDKHGSVWRFMLRDRSGRELLSINSYLRDRDAVLAAVVQALNALAEPVRITLEVEGGVLHDVRSNVPVEVLVTDFDTDGTDEDDLCDVTHPDGAEQAVVFVRAADVDPDTVTGRFAKYEATNGREC